MLNKLYHTLAKKYVVWISFLASLLIIILFVFLDHAGRPQDTPSPLVLQLTFSKDVFLSILNQWGEDGIKTYKTILVFDYLFPLFYSLFLASCLARLTINRNPAWRKFYLFLFTLPFISALLDWCENTFHFILLRDMSQISQTLVTISAISAYTKWSLGIFSFLLVYFFWWKKDGKKCCS